ncbi:MAG: hypothetical protein ACR2ND_02565 [Solirubrobacteraceae bacterium]
MRRQLPIMITLLALAVPASSFAGAADQQYKDPCANGACSHKKARHHKKKKHHAKKHARHHARKHH